MLQRLSNYLLSAYRNGELMFACAAAVPAVGPAMKNNFPEVLEYSWAFPRDGIVSTEENISFRERKIQIATPLTWWLISKWMDGYPYQAGIQWLVFVYTGLLVIVFALTAVAIQTVKAANSNPVESLKYE